MSEDANLSAVAIADQLMAEYFDDDHENVGAEPYALGDVGSHFAGDTARDVSHVRITAAGRLHRRWLSESESYLVAMCEDVVVGDEDTLERVVNLFNDRANALRTRQVERLHAVHRQICSTVRDYVLEEDGLYVSVPVSTDISLTNQAAVSERLMARFLRREVPGDWEQEELQES